MKNYKTYVIGDIHGNYEALKQVITKSNINKDNDRLIVLGDVVDGYHDVIECIDELLTFKNIIGIWGNHDHWAYNFLKFGNKENIWLNQGGTVTLNAYTNNPDKQKEHLDKYFSKLVYYYLENDMCFVHGGFDWKKGSIENTTPHDCMWDRNMVKTAQAWYTSHDTNDRKHRFPYYKTIFVGHTDTRYRMVTSYTPSLLPQFLSNLVMLDTGAGWKGRLTIMDVLTLEYWQSDENNY